MTSDNNVPYFNNTRLTSTKGLDRGGPNSNPAGTIGREKYDRGTKHEQNDVVKRDTRVLRGEKQCEIMTCSLRRLDLFELTPILSTLTD